MAFGWGSLHKGSKDKIASLLSLLQKRTVAKVDLENIKSQIGGLATSKTFASPYAVEMDAALSYRAPSGATLAELLVNNSNATEVLQAFTGDHLAALLKKGGIFNAIIHSYSRDGGGNAIAPKLTVEDLLGYVKTLEDEQQEKAQAFEAATSAVIKATDELKEAKKAQEANTDKAVNKSKADEAANKAQAEAASAAAAYKGVKEALQSALEQKDGFGRTPLIHAIRAGSTAVAEEILSGAKKIGIDVLNLLDAVDKYSHNWVEILALEGKYNDPQELARAQKMIEVVVGAYGEGKDALINALKHTSSGGIAYAVLAQRSDLFKHFVERAPTAIWMEDKSKLLHKLAALKNADAVSAVLTKLLPPATDANYNNEVAKLLNKQDATKALVSCMGVDETKYDAFLKAYNAHYNKAIIDGTTEAGLLSGEADGIIQVIEAAPYLSPVNREAFKAKVLKVADEIWKDTNRESLEKLQVLKEIDSLLEKIGAADVLDEKITSYTKSIIADINTVDNWNSTVGALKDTVSKYVEDFKEALHRVDVKIIATTACPAVRRCPA